jgi:hypothetical protein
VRASVYNGSGTYVEPTGSIEITANKWHHIVYVSDNSDNSFKIYVNGNLDVDTTLSIDINTSSTADFFLGQGGNFTSFRLDGQIGAFRFYSKALSASEVGQNYRHGRNFVYTDLIDDTDLELHLDPTSYSGSGSTWTADAGSNGTISGASYDQELGDWFDFDGVNDIITTTHDIPSTGAKTIEFWFNDNGSSGSNSTYPSPVGGSNVAIWTGGNLTGSYSDESLGFYNADTGLHFYIRTGTNTYRDNKWHHVAITDNGSNQHAVYVDGTSHAISYLSGSSSSRISMDNVQIGKGQSTPTTGLYSYYFHGQVGQIRVYSSALTQDQVRQNFNFTKNSYPNGYDGTISGATWNSSGYFDFDGTNDVVLPSYSPYQSSSALTMAAWINPDTVSVLQGVLSLRGDASNEVKFTININSDATLVLYSASTSNFLTLVSGNTNHKLSASNWHHIAASIDYSSKEFAVYLDGNLVSSGTNSSIRDASTFSVDRFDIGANYANQYFNGQIDSVKVYDKALSSAEITALYNEGQ